MRWREMASWDSRTLENVERLKNRMHPKISNGMQSTSINVCYDVFVDISSVLIVINNYENCENPLNLPFFKIFGENLLILFTKYQKK